MLEGREKVSEGCAISEAGSSGLFACFQGVYGPFLKPRRTGLSHMVSGMAAQSVSGWRRNITVRRILVM